MARILSRSGMGSHKHGVSGVAPKSPRLRHEMKREAEANERKRKPSTCTASSVAELFKDSRK